MKYLIPFFILTIFVSSHANAQHQIDYYPDSIRIEMPDQHSMIIFEFKSFKKDPEFIKKFPSMLSQWLEYVEKSMPSDFAAKGRYKIYVKLLPEGYKEIVSSSSENSYKPVGEKTLITIQRVDDLQTHVIIKEKQIAELLPPGWEVDVNSVDFKINVYSETFIELKKVASTDLSEASAKLVNDEGMKTMGKKSIRARMIYQQNKLSFDDIDYIYPGDNLNLGVNAGVGLYGDKIYPELSFGLGLSFKDRFFRQNIRATLLNNNLFFAEKSTEGFNLYTNSFLSLVFEKNFAKGTGVPRWTGLGAGLLVQKNGDYFTGKTAKFFITHNMGRVNLVPEFYLTNDYKKFAFGMTLKYSF